MKHITETPIDLLETIQTVLSEAIATHGDDFIAYLIVLAEEYKSLPKYRESDLYRWEAMLKHIDAVLPIVMSGVKVEYTTDDPYMKQRDMMYDMIVNRRMKIYKTSEPNAHPAITNQENDKFRAVHDYMGHFKTNEKAFRQFLAKNGIKDGQDGKLKDYRFSKNSFTVRGEFNTFLTHAKMLPKEAVPALFTEVCGQISVYFVTGDFTENKAAIIDGVDYNNIGHFTDSKLEKRKLEYRKLLEDDSVKTFKTDFGQFDKSKIRWNLLSHGEGKSRPQP